MNAKIFIRHADREFVRNVFALHDAIFAVGVVAQNGGVILFDQLTRQTHHRVGINQSCYRVPSPAIPNDTCMTKSRFQPYEITVRARNRMSLNRHGCSRIILIWSIHC